MKTTGTTFNRNGRQVKVSIPSKLDDELYSIINQFPEDAETWRDATDEIRDLAHNVRCSYNELVLDVCEGDKGYIEALNFRTFKTPSCWNTEAKKQILTLWSKMNDWAKENALR